MSFLTGKRALIVGVASDRSIATGIAEAMHREGAELAFTYQNEKLESRVRKLAAACDSQRVFPCDVARDEDISAVFRDLRTSWDTFDILVHSVAFAPKEELEGDYLEVSTRQGFQTAHDISSYSFTALARAARPLLRSGGALLTLSYLGAERALPNYNVMGLAKASLEANVRYLAQRLGPQGVRVNALSAGPIRTLAASGIAGFRRILDYYEANAPLRRNVTIEEVGNTGAFLCSDLSSGITGEVIHVDGGFHVVGLPASINSSDKS
ncbi:MAG TPA: enoyl-ACP reductase [Acidiferrobacteraceae bacterium]|nr:enoyl-ACP reductase [Acidiferrobacteraceae bacterium]